MANSWGESGTTWSQGDWGQQNVTTVVISSGFSITSTLGEAQSYPEQGWGSDTWGTENWGESASTVSLSGFSITASLGTLDYAASIAGWGRDTWGENDWGDSSLSIGLSSFSITGSVGEATGFSEQGWGRATWGNEPWGESNSPTVALSGLAITGSLGTLPYAQSESGWGRDEWGIGNWGENTTTVVLTTGLEMTGLQGPSGWGLAPWDEMVGWGGDLRCETTQLTIATPTGLAITGSVGTPTLNYDYKLVLTTSLQMSAGIGVLNINDGADHSQGVGSLLATMSVGSLGHEMAYDLTGIEATLSLGTPVITETQLISLTGLEITGEAIGIPTIADMAVGLSTLLATGSVGSLTITDVQIGISGLEMTGALGSAGMSPLHYKDVDITGNTSYTYVEHSA